VRKGEDAIDRPRILVAHDLATYAKSLATILPELRPDLRVHLLGAEELEVLIQSLPGAIVICARLTPAVAAHSSGWILFHPDRENVLVVGGKGTPYRIVEPDLVDVLDAVDVLIAQLAASAPLSASENGTLSHNNPSRERTPPAGLP